MKLRRSEIRCRAGLFGPASMPGPTRLRRRLRHVRRSFSGARKGPGLQSLVLLCCFCAVATVSAENWPQWRGPSLNGLSAEKNLPVRWSKTENVTWKVDLPAWSGSTPVVWGDRIFLNVAEDLRVRAGANLFLWCVDRNKGTVLWKRPLGGGNHQERKQNMSTP